MKIEITKFKFYTEYVEYDFKEKDLNLLIGDSNSGKTTIFEAIYWCLYGSNKVVYPKGLKASNNKPTKIKLTFDNGTTIQRIKPPDALTVELNESISLSDESAQEWIDQFFGTKTSFLATTYMKQKKENPLLELKISEKKDLLHELTFGKLVENKTHEDSQFYLEKIDSELKNVKNDILKSRAKINLLKEQFSKQKILNKKYHTIWYGINSIHPTDDLIKEMERVTIDKEKKIVTLKKELSISRKEWERYNYDFKRYESNQKILEDLIKKQELIPYTIIELDIMSKNIAEKEKYDMHKSQLLKARQLIDDKSFEFLQHCNIPEIKHVIFELKEFQKTFKKLNLNVELNWESNKNTILDNIMYLEKRLADDVKMQNTQKQYNLLIKTYQLLKNEKLAWTQQIQNLKNTNDLLLSSKEEYDNYFDSEDIKNALIVANCPIVDNAKSTLSKFYTVKTGFGKLLDIYREIIFKTTISDAVYNCPSCSTNLKLQNNTLSLLDHKELPIEQKILLKNNANKSIVTIQRLEKLLKIYKKNKAALEDLSKVNIVEPEDPEEWKINNIKPNNAILLTTQEISNITSQLRLLQNIELPMHDLINTDLPIQEIYDNMLNIEVLIKKSNDYSIYMELLKNFNKIRVPDELSVIPNDSIQKYRTQILSVTSQIKNVKNELTDCDIMKPVNSIEELEDLLGQFEMITKNNTALIESGTRILEFTELKLTLDKNESTLDKLISRQMNLDKIKQHITETESYALEETVDTINSVLSQITAILYDNDTHVTLSMFKKLKTRDYLKAQPTIEISRGYGDDEIIYDIEELSGGEKSRLSLAITLALSTIGTTPFLFLDESMSSMHPSLRDRCIKVIKEHTTNKTIINVCHGISEGIHSNCVSIHN
jgi:exonuclease SbcC